MQTGCRVLSNSTKSGLLAAFFIPKLLEAVERAEIRYKKDTVSLTISIGAVFAEDSLDVGFSELLSKADKLLYTAKKNGRNQVLLE